MAGMQKKAAKSDHRLPRQAQFGVCDGAHSGRVSHTELTLCTTFGQQMVRLG